MQPRELKEKSISQMRRESNARKKLACDEVQTMKIVPPLKLKSPLFVNHQLKDTIKIGEPVFVKKVKLRQLQ